MIERRIEADTEDGPMTTFVVHPEDGGPHPVVLYLMDAPSIRPALHDMASRLATAGYYVMLPFLYHRGSEYREFGKSDEDMHHRRGLMQTVTREGVGVDARALLAVAEADPAAADGPAGAVGFCMSGPQVVFLAQDLPDRFAAVAGVHPAWTLAQGADAPDRHVDRIRAEVYLAWADADPLAPVEAMATTRDALEAAGVRHRVELMEGALHGFAPPDHDNYHRAASERHWERVHALFGRNLDRPAR